MRILRKNVAFAAILLSMFASCTNEDIPHLNPTAPIADAGIARIISLPVNFDTLKGKDSSFNGPIYGRLWSLISGPNVPVIESPSSRTTRVSNMIEGVYKFQYAVIDSAGLTGVDTTRITVLPDARPTITLSLQPANNVSEALLSWTSSGAVTGANFAITEIAAAAWTYNSEPFIIRGLCKFDLSSIPANAIILSAKLSLYSNPSQINGYPGNPNSGVANDMYIERITSNWSSSLTWSNQPSTDLGTQVLIPHTNLPTLDLIDVDVKNLVSGMTGTNNYGFKIRLVNEYAYNMRNFCSSKHPLTAKHPKLIISYK
jgi:hypothetical protein